MATPTIADKEIRIVVEKTPSGTQVTYRCDHCGRNHLHGHSGDGDPGYRESHCHNEKSPHYGKTVRLVLAEGSR